MNSNPNLFAKCLWVAILAFYYLAKTSCEKNNSKCIIKTMTRGNKSFAVKCTVDDLTLLGILLKEEEPHVRFLDLSCSSIGNIPVGVFRNYSGLFSLSLANNKIRTILPGTFAGLKNLVILNMKGNDLQEWKGNLSADLVSLQHLNVFQNFGWRPKKNVLDLPKLVSITGLSWSTFCYNCSLLKISSYRPSASTYYSVTEVFKRQSTCKGKKYTPSVFLSTASSLGFHLEKCAENLQCISEETSEETVTRCYGATKKFSYCLIVIGALAIWFNFTVTFVTLLSRTLHSNVSTFLTGSLALSDLVTGIYTIAIASFQNNYSSVAFKLVIHSVCPKLGFFWVVGQMTTIVTSTLLTIERYLAIRFTLRPDIRLSMKHAGFSTLFSWLIAVLIAAYPLYQDMYTNSYICSPFKPRLTNSASAVYTLGLSGLGILLYVISFGLYLHIFVIVKRSSQTVRVSRESVLAQRIALLVMTNLVFFVVPMLCSGLFYMTAEKLIKRMQPIARRSLTDWLPVFCFSLNACLNPVLYSFRNDRFKQSLKKIVKRVFWGKRSSKIEPLSFRGSVRHKNRMDTLN